MRRILFPLLVIGLAGGLFTLGSGAFFSDVETDTGNTITAGSLDLEKTTSFASTCSFPAPTKPGDSDATCTALVTNIGTITGDLHLRISIAETDPSTNEPECVAETGTWTVSCAGNTVVNDLGAVLDIAAGSAGGTGDEQAGATTLAALATWNAAGGFGCTFVSILEGTETFTFTLPTTFSTAAGNQYQTDTATLTFHYELVQSGQPATCP